MNTNLTKEQKIAAIDKVLWAWFKANKETFICYALMEAASQITGEEFKGLSRIALQLFPELQEFKPEGDSAIWFGHLETYGNTRTGILLKLKDKIQKL